MDTNATVGKEQPYIKAGPFKVRFPFVHYRFEVADFVQGLLMCAVCLGAIPLLCKIISACPLRWRWP